MSASDSPDALRLRGRLARLAELQDGWYDGAAAAPSQAAVQQAQHFLAALGDPPAELQVFPTITGGLSFEIYLNRDDQPVWWQLELAADGGLDVACGSDDINDAAMSAVGDLSQAVESLRTFLAAKQTDF